MPLHRFFIALILIASWHGPAAATEPVTLLMHQLKYRLDLEGTKHYNMIAEDVFAGVEDRLEVQIIPLPRWPAEWTRGPRTCTFPSSIPAVKRYTPDKQLISSVPLDIVSVRVYLPSGAPDITSLADLEGKNTAFIRGSVAEKLIAPFNIEPMLVRTDEQLISMLRLGRLDAFLGYHPDTAIALETLGGKGLMQVSKFSPEEMRFPVGVVCYGFEGVEQLLRPINRNIIRLHREGRVAAMLGKHAEMPSEEELELWIERAEKDASAIN